MALQEVNVQEMMGAEILEILEEFAKFGLLAARIRVTKVRLGISAEVITMDAAQDLLVTLGFLKKFLAMTTPAPPRSP